jgi:pyruvate dehydrogenase E1 component
METSRAMRLGGKPAATWIETQLPANGVPIVAASDYVSAVADLIRPWVRDPYVALGTDGFGRSDTRENLRRFFEVDRRSIALAALAQVDEAKAGEARARYAVEATLASPWRR